MNININTRQSDVSILNSLTALCIDSARGYREAAGQSNNTSFAELCYSRAEERDRLAREFQTVVAEMGGRPEAGGTISGSAHRLMMDVRAMIGNNIRAAVVEIERGEDLLKEAFERAMDRTDICQRVRSLIALCYSDIRDGHDRMSELKRVVA